jgi:NtrC-family two-component system response regulator AlgB
VSRDVDVRIVSASNRDLRALVRERVFREDLYYRLGGLTIELPPLRRRTGDAQLLAKRFLRAARREGRVEAERFTPAALRAIAAHPWPGNVRELKNVVERAVVLASGDELGPADLGLSAPTGVSLAGASGSGRSLAELESEAIRHALGTHATLTAAARALGIDRRTLRRRMARHGIQRAT